MNEKRCNSCRYFLQHYTFDKRKIFRVHCGHCTVTRAKRLKPDSPACKNYVPGTAQEEAFASKEYLSKELLQYVLNLELLPEIHNNEQGN